MNQPQISAWAKWILCDQNNNNIDKIEIVESNPTSVGGVTHHKYKVRKQDGTDGFKMKEDGSGPIIEDKTTYNPSI